MNRSITFLLLFLALPWNAFSQKVTVSQEINVRNNFAYDIFPHMGDRIIFYHDRGSDQNFEVFDQELKYINTVNIELDKKILPLGVISADEHIKIYYSYRDTGHIHLAVRSFDKTIRSVDTVLLSVRLKKSNESAPRFYFSEDKSKVVIITAQDKGAIIAVIDNIKHEVIYEYEFLFAGFNLKSDYDRLAISNHGDIWLLLQKESIWHTNEDASFHLFHINKQGESRHHLLEAEEGKISDIQIKLDDVNNRLALGGFVGEDKDSRSKGFFGKSYPTNNLDDIITVPINHFDAAWLAKTTGKKIGQKRELENYRARNLVIRRDGGVILVAELVREFLRRMGQPGNFNDQMFGRNGGQVDYHYEDIIVYAFEPDGKAVWDNLLFKKQFSQDDYGIYSSHFLFKTGGRLKFIYNDEIKNANTVSEYVLDPLGNFERRSVLSTEYQNLRLRFKDAIQTGPKTLVVPSEKSFRINIVKIDFE
jgi:hypothetical protein